jgi:ribulose bisphosphate carboxylase small subunit
MGKRTAATTEKALGGAPARVSGESAGFDSRGCGQGEGTVKKSNAQVVKALQTLISSGHLLLWNQDTNELEDAAIESACLNGSGVQLNLRSAKKTSRYSVGQTIKVLVERQTIYDNHGHVPANHVSCKTLVVLSVHENNPGTYSVKVKGPGTVLRFQEAKGDGSFGSLSGKRVRYDVVSVLDSNAPKLTDEQVEREVTAILQAKYYTIWVLPSEIRNLIWADHPSTSYARIQDAIKRLEEQKKIERHHNGRYVRYAGRNKRAHS